MKTFKLEFEETVTIRHFIVVKTELDQDDLSDLIDDLELEDLTAQDVAAKLDCNDDVIIEEIIEGNPDSSDIECVDIMEQ